MAMAALHYHVREREPGADEYRNEAFGPRPSIVRHTLAANAVASGALPLHSLRKWLHGSWALLFSHADDFASYGFEADRWLLMVREACAAADVRPLALASSSSHSTSWITEVGGRVATLPLDETQRYPVLRDACEQVLCETIRTAGSRFVLILDDALRLRRTFAYVAHDRVPSPIDLVAMTQRLRSARAECGAQP